MTCLLWFTIIPDCMQTVLLEVSEHVPIAENLAETLRLCCMKSAVLREFYV